MERRKINIRDVHANSGQVEGLPANPRQIKDERFRKLVQSIQDLPEMTEARDLLVYQHNGGYVVIGGNMRLRAYQELGWEEVPCCILPENMPAGKLREITIQDNNPFGETDWDMIANDWDVEELKDWGVDLPEDWDTPEADGQKEADEDDFSEEEAEQAEPRVKLGEIWHLGGHRLMCGDSTDAASVALLMDGTIADLYLTDPPYNVDYSSKNEALNAVDKGNRIQVDIANDRMEDGRFVDFLIQAFRNADDHLKPGGVFYIWHADSQGYNFRTAIRETGWQLRQCLIWNKNVMVIGRQDYQWKHEPCLYGWKSGAAHYFIDRRDLTTVYEDGEIDIDSMKKAELKELLKKFLSSPVPTTIIDEKKPARSEDHPTMKPLRLMGRLIRNSTRPGELVLDTFGGSGTTIIAAEQLERKVRLMELDPHYCDVIIARWEKLTGKEAVKIHG